MYESTAITLTAEETAIISLNGINQFILRKVMCFVFLCDNG
jgi:hypothetical protein